MIIALCLLTLAMMAMMAMITSMPQLFVRGMPRTAVVRRWNAYCTVKAVVGNIRRYHGYPVSILAHADFTLENTYKHDISRRVGTSVAFAPFAVIAQKMHPHGHQSLPRAR